MRYVVEVSDTDTVAGSSSGFATILEARRFYAAECAAQPDTEVTLFKTRFPKNRNLPITLFWDILDRRPARRTRPALPLNDARAGRNCGSGSTGFDQVPVKQSRRRTRNARRTQDADP